ncbi:MAG: diguanylate cyclase (GGDEF)-like protein [Paraglaciecola psychrophila]|jgi:diguanylate cyclase (GGDEF)-like protein
MPTTVQQSNTFAFPSRPKDKAREQSIDKNQYTDLRLKITTLLQISLELEQVLKSFFDEVQQHIPLASLEYNNPRINNTVNCGRPAKNSIDYRLENQQGPLGTILFTCARRFTEVELGLLEMLIGCLICPLRNALLYREAVQHSLEDPLTGAGNRLALENTLTREVGLALRHKQALSVVVVDIDHFKRVNDDHGHQAGDKVLKDVAKQLAHCCRDTDSAYRAFRYGGEEFVLILSNTSTEGSLIVGERIRSSIETLGCGYEEKTLEVTVSVGVSSLLSDDTMSRLFERADKALYNAKNKGRNQVVSAITLGLEPAELAIS